MGGFLGTPFSSHRPLTCRLGSIGNSKLHIGVNDFLAVPECFFKHTVSF